MNKKNSQFLSISTDWYIFVLYKSSIGDGGFEICGIGGIPLVVISNRESGWLGWNWN